MSNSTQAPTQLKLDWEAWLTLSLIILGGIILVTNKADADMVFLGAVCILNLAGVITTKEAIAGFSSSGVLTVGILMVVAAGITNTGALGYFMSKALGRPRTVKRALIHLLIPVGICSSFINDTPVFLMFVPIFQAWYPKLGMDPRLFYVPMSFTCLLAGTVTLIGTSTNLVIAGKAEQEYPDLPIPLFGVAIVGLPTLLFGLSFIILTAEYLLPNKYRNVDMHTEDGAHERRSDRLESIPHGFDLGSMTLKAKVNYDSPVIGQTIQDAGLRGLGGLFLVAVCRDDLCVHSVDPLFILKEDDQLNFTGSPEGFVDLCQSKGLKPVTVDPQTENEEAIIMDEQTINTNRSTLLKDAIISVIVRDGSSLVGKTPREYGFRNKFHASIMSIQRAGADIQDSNLGRITLEVGDVLALLVGDGFDPESPGTSSELKILQKGLTQSSGLPYIVGARVITNARLKLAKSLDGVTIEKAGLRGLPGAYLVGVTKGDSGVCVRAVGSDEVLHTGDICWFTGARDCIITIRRIPGLELLHERQAKKLKSRSEQRNLLEVVIAPTSSMIGSTVKEVRFRTRFGAAVVAIRRSNASGGGDGMQNIGDMELRVGDVLMLDAGPDFLVQHEKDPNFLLIGQVQKSTPPQFGKFYFSLLCVVTMFAVFVGTQTKVSLIPLGLACSGLMLLARVMTPQQAREAVNWEVLVTIAAAFGVSSAMENSGLAEAIGSGLVSLAVRTGSGEAGIISALYISTTVISLFVANNAAALLMFTIATAAGEEYNIDPYKIFYTLMMAASSSYLIPYGYQTNIMCLSLGPYTTKEFSRFGIPLQLFIGPITIVLLIYMEQWVIGFVTSIVFFVVSLLIFYIWKPTSQQKRMTELSGPDKFEQHNKNSSINNNQDESGPNTPQNEKSRRNSLSPRPSHDLDEVVST